MGAKFEIGRIGGLPIFIDVSFILLVVLWGADYFTSGSATAMSVGFLIVVGLALSILLHELAHAVVGNALGVRPSHVELNGLGGLCYWAGPMRPEAWRRIAISLAGPAANLLLYYIFGALAGAPGISDNRFVAGICRNLAIYNLVLCLFNMLPAFPLDGGKALEALLGKVLSAMNARRVVGVLGLCVAAYLVYLGISGNMWMLLLAVLIGLANYDAVQSANNPPWQRWN